MNYTHLIVKWCKLSKYEHVTHFVPNIKHKACSFSFLPVVIRYKQKKGVSEKVSYSKIITCREIPSQAFFYDNLSTKHKEHNLKFPVFLIAEKHELIVIEQTNSERFVDVL